MKQNKYPQAILCEGKTFAESVEIFNREMRMLKGEKFTYERKDDSYIIYVECVDRQPEGIAEAREMQGIRHTCVECDHCIRQMNRYGVPDARIKKAVCNKDGHMTTINTRVCNTYYIEHQDEEKKKYKKLTAKGA